MKGILSSRKIPPRILEIIANETGARAMLDLSDQCLTFSSIERRPCVVGITPRVSGHVASSPSKLSLCAAGPRLSVKARSFG